MEEEEEDEVPSLPLGVTGILCSLFHAGAKSQGLTLSFQSKLQFSSELCESGVGIHDMTLADVQLSPTFCSWKCALYTHLLVLELLKKVLFKPIYTHGYL